MCAESNVSLATLLGIATNIGWTPPLGVMAAVLCSYTCPPIKCTDTRDRERHIHRVSVRVDTYTTHTQVQKRERGSDVCRWEAAASCPYCCCCSWEQFHQHNQSLTKVEMLQCQNKIWAEHVCRKHHLTTCIRSVSEWKQLSLAGFLHKILQQ